METTSPKSTNPDKCVLCHSGIAKYEYNNGSICRGCDCSLGLHHYRRKSPDYKPNDTFENRMDKFLIGLKWIEN
jgi:hypothetical protein